MDFNGKLSSLCHDAMKEANGDPEMNAEIIERLVNALAFTIAVTCEGQSKAMNMMLAGCEQQMYEAAAGHKEAAAFLAQISRR